MNAIEIRHFSLSFGNLPVINDVSLTVSQGEVVALIGPSGCGKSTLLRVVAGIIPAMIPATIKGEVSVLGKGPEKLLAGDLDMVFQENCLLPWRSVFSNVSLGLEITHANPQVTPQRLLELMGLTGFERSLPRQLSGGMKQRVSLATSLLVCPEIVLMDEPFANIDALTREQLWQLMENLRLRQLLHTVLLVTHSIEEAVVLADRVLVMSSRPGRVIAEVVVNLSRPRINTQGLFASGFGEICNQVRAHIRGGER